MVSCVAPGSTQNDKNPHSLLPTLARSTAVNISWYYHHSLGAYIVWSSLYFCLLDTLEDSVFSCLLLSHIKPLPLKGSSKFNNLLNTAGVGKHSEKCITTEYAELLKSFFNKEGDFRENDSIVAYTREAHPEWLWRSCAKKQEFKINPSTRLWVTVIKQTHREIGPLQKSKSRNQVPRSPLPQCD